MSLKQNLYSQVQVPGFIIVNMKQRFKLQLLTGRAALVLLHLNSNKTKFLGKKIQDPH